MVVIVLVAICALLLVLEQRGVRTTMTMSFKGDLKRETAFVAQYGQSIATPLAAMIVWSFDIDDWVKPVALIASVFVTAVAAFILKRLCGRVRPNRPNAGAFTGPLWKLDNKRESFPSSHSACAIALSMVLIYFFPELWVIMWCLALATALLRWMMAAHYPSDIAAGLALGY
ncbi:MAG TPA: phosphatase PAP2 family protein, partial [Tepidisphaeraceae bacterium]|nr:phosphatase PAP2 family protein [Tepidisphaeraceae bacterium]